MEDLKIFDEKNPQDLTKFMNGKNITGFNMTLDDKFSVITLHLDNEYVATIHFPTISDFTINKLGK